MLMQAGWPRQALLVTVVRDKRGDGHAVLTVKTDKGEFVLDNQNPEILLWSQTGYRFVKRQSGESEHLDHFGRSASGSRYRNVALTVAVKELRDPGHVLSQLPADRGSRVAGSPPRAGHIFLTLVDARSGECTAVRLEASVAFAKLHEQAGDRDGQG